MSKKFFKYLNSVLLVFAGSFSAWSQSGPPGNPNPPNDNPVPIGGLEILLLAGAGLGVKKLLDKRKP